jgi:serine/threonine protein kinase
MALTWRDFMASELFYTHDGKSTAGPVSSAQLQTLAKSGQLLPTDMVWREGMAQWTSASEIKGLFLSASPGSPVFTHAPTFPVDTVQGLAVLALRPLVGYAVTALGIPGGELLAEGVGKVVGFLGDRFKDESQRLPLALKNANEKAWQALEVALAGESFWKRLTANGEDRGFAQQIGTFLDYVATLPELGGKPDFRQRCLDDLRKARKKGFFTGTNYDTDQLARLTGEFARYADPVGLLDAEWDFIGQLAVSLENEGHASLANLLKLRPPQGMPLLVIGVRYYFRRAIEEDGKLFQGVAYAKLEALGEAQQKGFAALSAAVAQQGERLEEVLGGVQAVVVQTHSAVLGLQGQIQGQGEQIGQLGQAVMQLLQQHQLQRREVRPGDSLSIRNEGERQLVRQLVARYRSLPEGERRNVPALLNAIGKLEVVVGDFEAAQRDFQQVATLVSDTTAQAEAHANAYRAALERRDWDTALRELQSAVKLDPKRFAPFPVGKYHPRRILGAGGFGVAFLCRHKDLQAEVVVKTLTGDDLERDVDEVLGEARVLYLLDHPAIIRVLDCGYTIPAEKTRPYFVMNFFDGVTLEEYVEEHGPLPPEDVVAVARQMTEGLQAAHGKGILHRDVKPANLLVRKDGTGWRVKLIDFGLALKQSVVEAGVSTARRSKTLTGSSIAGTLDYAAPEQMGKLPGVSAGVYSDIYGFGKTCCYALFKTTQPLPKHWKALPTQLAELLEKCLEGEPKARPQDFSQVLSELTSGESAVQEMSQELRRAGILAQEQWGDVRSVPETAKLQTQISSVRELVALTRRLMSEGNLWRIGCDNKGRYPKVVRAESGSYELPRESFISRMKYMFNKDLLLHPVTELTMLFNRHHGLHLQPAIRDDLRRLKEQATKLVNEDWFKPPTCVVLIVVLAVLMIPTFLQAVWAIFVPIGGLKRHQLRKDVLKMIDEL